MDIKDDNIPISMLVIAYACFEDLEAQEYVYVP